MFKLPIKEVIVNSDTVVTSDGTLGTPAAGDVITIEGFGAFVVPTTTGAPFGHVTPTAPAVAGIFDITPPATATIVAGEVHNLHLTFDQAGRVLSDIWTYGEQRTFQSAPLATGDSLGWATAFVDGQTVNPEYFGMENVLSFSVAGTGPNEKLRVTFKPGYEGIGIRMARSIDAFNIVGIETTLDITTVTEASEGVNLGKQIEAEVRNATFDNIDPYGINFGGNTAVDVRSTYTETHFVSGPHLNGFEPHGVTGYGDANTETNHAAVEMSVYTNDASVGADVLTALAALVTGI